MIDSQLSVTDSQLAKFQLTDLPLQQASPTDRELGNEY